MRRMLVLSLWLSAPVFADLEVDRRLSAGSEGDAHVVLVRERYDQGHQRVDILDPVEKKVTARLSLFDIAKAEMYLFEDKEKKYLVASQKQFEAMAKNPNRKVAAKDGPATFTRAGTRTVGEWKCSVYRVTRAGKRLGEVCTVPLPTLALTAEDLGSFGRVGELNWDARSGADRTDWMYETRYGFPIQVMGERSKQLPVSRMEVLAVRKVAAAAETFKLPDGYKRAEMPALPGQIAVPAPHDIPSLPR